MFGKIVMEKKRNLKILLPIVQWTNKKNFYAKKILEICSNYGPQECEMGTHSVSVKSSKTDNSETHVFFYYSRACNELTGLVSVIRGILGLFLGIS